MRTPFPEVVNRCRRCGANNPAIYERCLACGGALTVYIGPAERIPRRIGLGALMLMIALVAVCLGIARESPILGVALLLAGVPASFRTIQRASRRQADGRPMRWSERVGDFVFLLALAGFIWGTGLLATAFGLWGGAVLGMGLSMLQTGDLSNGQVTGWNVIVPGVPCGVVAGYFTTRSAFRYLWWIGDNGP